MKFATRNKNVCIMLKKQLEIMVLTLLTSYLYHIEGTLAELDRF
jgi:hypothetical protein